VYVCVSAWPAMNTQTHRRTPYTASQAAAHGPNRSNNPFYSKPNTSSRSDGREQRGARPIAQFSRLPPLSLAPRCRPALQILFKTGAVGMTTAFRWDMIRAFDTCGTRFGPCFGFLCLYGLSDSVLKPCLCFHNSTAHRCRHVVWRCRARVRCWNDG
jgi:hypothetical protein